MLKFLIQGSATEPYTVTADGRGAGLRMFCSCPAGKKGGRPCKHIKAVLEGVAANLVQPSDDLQSLAEAAAGSPYVEWAKEYEPPLERDRVLGCSTLQEGYSLYLRVLEGAGWSVTYSEDGGDFPSKELAVFARLKNGGVRKTPRVSLRWEMYAWDAVVTPDGGSRRANVRPRSRPFTVRGVGETATYGDVGKALCEFLRRSEVAI